MKKVLNLLVIISLVSGIVIIHGCKKDPTLPILTTAKVSALSTSGATSGGNITSDGNADIIARGVCWNTSTQPAITNSKTTDGTGSGIFTSNISGLQPGTTYFVRAYATNSVGTSYGEEFIFNTKIADVEGNTYNTVTIGTQVWMAENLKTTKYNDNSSIPNVTGNTAWVGLTTPAYCWYNNDEANSKAVYGALYNWYAVNNVKLCPAGWHVPTDVEYNTMELSIGIPVASIDTWGWRGTDQGSQMKSTTGWNTGENGTNKSGFTAIPGGYRFYGTGVFNSQGSLGYWWSATQLDATTAWYRRLDGNNTGVYKASTDKKAGKSVRCVKN